MTDDSEWLNLPTIEKVENKLWKARLAGYNEAIKLFETQTSDKSPVFNDYLNLLKKMVTDSNAIAQERALDVVLVFLENASVAPRAASDVCEGILSKCLNAARAKTKERGMEILLYYIELEKQDVVLEELIKGLSVKQPKTVISCLQTLRMALAGFGSKVISIKAILKDTLRLLEDRDQNVRNECKELIVEMYRWAGAPIKTQLSSLKPVQLSELESEFAKCSGQKPMPTRYLKSQKPKELSQHQNNNASAPSDPALGGDASGSISEPELDPYDLADPVNILSKLPKDFYEQIEAKKWQERKEALNVVENLTDVIKLSGGDYGELIKALVKVITKDTNVILVGQSAKIVAQIANGLRKGFQPYAGETIRACIDKFKEKKPAILNAIRGAADAALKATTLEAIQDDVIAATTNKVPTVRAEVCMLLQRAFSNMTVATLNKKLLKAFVGPLLKCSGDTAGEVREASFAALGTAMYVVTEKNITPFLVDVDAIRIGRIKEFYEKAVDEKKKGGNGKTTNAPTAAAVAEAPKPPQRAAVKGGTKPGGVKDDHAAGGGSRPGTATSKPPTKSKSGVSTGSELPKESLMGDDVVEAKLIEFFGEGLLTELASSVWKERLASMETVQSKIRSADASQLSCQLVCRLMMRKPGLKDNNFQVLRMRVETITEILQARKPVGEIHVELLLPELMDKIGDVKVGEAVKQALTALAEATSFDIVGNQVLAVALQQKSPKNQVEAVNWLSNAIKEFGFKLNPKQAVSSLKIGLGASNVQVRQAFIQLSGVLYLYMGNTLRTLMAEEKSSIVAAMEEEWGKLGNTKPPAPTRGIRLQKGVSVGDDEVDEQTAEPEVAAPDPEELVDRANISEKLGGEVQTLITSKNWKERKEGLEKIDEVLKANPFISGGSDMQEPLGVIAKLCTDVNKILGKTTLGLMEAFAKALSKADSKKLVRFVEPHILPCFGDSKPQFREAAVSALTAWKDKCGIIPMTENDMLTEALKAENPNLRAELIGWLTTALTGQKLNTKAAINAGLSPDFGPTLATLVYAVCEDRNSEPRQRAQKILPVLIRALGLDTMQKAMKRLKPGNQVVIEPLLEKAREQVAAEDPPASTAQASAPKTVRGGGGAAKKPPPPQEEDLPTSAASNPDFHEDASAAPSKSSAGKKPIAKRPTMTSKRAAALEQAEEAASVVPLQLNKLRETRIQDEKKRKLLKWDFDTPTKDHVQQLSALFQTAGASPDLHACLFHTDFKQHIKAVDTLTRLLEGGWPSVDGDLITRANLDLILRWMVLRFFETSPAFLARGLEYLLKVFSRMSDNEQQLTEHEASAFLSYLVMKVGDSKENIRRDIRAIFRVMTSIYPPEKLYTYLIGGLKSKVNKARQECLEEIESMIDHFGLNVCQPSPAASLKILAAQISDRDSGVRTAALNALVCVYSIVGEPLWKMLGQMPDKERSMLEERIKRSGRSAVASAGGSNATPSASKRAISEKPTNRRRGTTRETQAAVASQDVSHTPYGGVGEGTRGGPQSVHAIAYARAQHMLSGLGDLNPEQPSAMPNLLTFDRDINEIFKPIKIPELKSRDKQTVLNCLLRTSPDAASAITMVVTQISSNDLTSCCHALSQIDALLQSDKWQLLVGHINQIVTLITIQLRQTNSRFFDDPTISENELSNVLRCLFATTDSIFKRPLLAREASRESLKEYLFASLNLMVHERTAELPEGSGIIRAINAITLLVIMESNSTRVLGAFIRLLHESVSSGHFTNRFSNLVLRSLWKITKSLSETANNYSLDQIFLDCHNFLKAFPSPSWKTRKSDLPLRTIKTMLHAFCCARGPAVLKFVDMLPNKEESELETYVKRTLKALASENGGKLPPALQTNPKQSNAPLKTAVLSSDSQAKLSSLIAKITSSRDESLVEELYDFTSSYPDLDLQPYLTDFTPFFQTYIRQALFNVGLKRSRVRSKQSTNGLASTTNGVTNDQQTLSGEDLNKQSLNPKFFMDRLASIRKELGLESMGVTDGDNTQECDADGRISSGLYGNTGIDFTKEGGQEKGDVGASEDTPSNPQQAGGGMSHTDLLDIRKRLEAIKSAQMRG